MYCTRYVQYFLMLDYFNNGNFSPLLLLPASFKVLRTAIGPETEGEESSLLAEICYEEPYLNGRVTQTVCCSIPAIQPWRPTSDNVVDARSGMYICYDQVAMSCCSQLSLPQFNSLLANSPE